MISTIFEKSRITSKPLVARDCWAIIYEDAGYFDARIHKPARTVVSSVHGSEAAARRALKREGGQIIHLPYVVAKGDTLAIQDGRDIAAEIGR